MIEGTLQTQNLENLYTLNGCFVNLNSFTDSLAGREESPNYLDQKLHIF